MGRWDRLCPKILFLAQPVGCLIAFQLGEVPVLLGVVRVFILLPVSDAPVPRAALRAALLSALLLVSALAPLLELRVQLPTVGLPVPLLLAVVADHVLVVGFATA